MPVSEVACTTSLSITTWNRKFVSPASEQDIRGSHRQRAVIRLEDLRYGRLLCAPVKDKEWFLSVYGVLSAVEA
ncbi:MULTISPECIES: hypothetical protein [unclassified Arthrobacter]|uniref:hypothetical protein n=1 Tax=unclassified Arthrobacter TaxID=235627 RepID=UPI002E0009C5|nr:MULTISPECIES: hypothetical protein [unclassified Arthrobacter]MEC5193247.1 hypothetical protein [Arthrobacter sp. MP_M4]MEC5204713.1 hypothetical protein [Arthrobacter sp. MP_M7]